MKKNIFIIGSKGIPARYGGFETFVENLTKYWKRDDVKFHVACPKTDSVSEYEYNNARCFIINLNRLGSYRSLIFDLAALRQSLNYISRNKLTGSIIYMLTCRVGPFLNIFQYIIKKNKVKMYLNPDGLEHKRKKWGKLGRLYWKISKALAIRYADLIICDSREIQKIISNDFVKSSGKTTYIPYGAKLPDSKWQDKNIEAKEWFIKNNLSANNYYLYAGRFIPENNIEFIIDEYVNSGSEKYLVLITNIDYERVFYSALNKKLNLDKNKKILFPGPIYDEDLLKTVRENAFAYIHGHEVGGTNPSLLESMAITRINLVLRVAFNEEVCADSVLYFEKTPGSLERLILKTEKDDPSKLDDLSGKAKSRIAEYYNWDKIIKEYEKLF